MSDGPQPECRLLGGPPAWLAQGLLGLAALLGLIYKRHKEVPRRALDVWAFDVAKQVLSMLVAHMCGMLIAMLASSADHRIVSECAWYFVAFAFDTTLGVALAIALHNLAVGRARKNADQSYFAACVAECGHYGIPPQLSRFWPQAVEWMGVVIAARFICGLTVLILRGGLIYVARLLDLLFAGSPIALLYFVMICCPLLMNLLQALLQDMALKRQAGHLRFGPPTSQCSDAPADAFEHSHPPLRC